MHSRMMKRRAIVNIFVHSIYLYDDHLTLIINGSNKPVTVDDIPFDDIEAAFNGEKAAMEQCSHSSDIVPPQDIRNSGCLSFLSRNVTRRHGFTPRRRVVLLRVFDFQNTLSMILSQQSGE